MPTTRLRSTTAAAAVVVSTALVVPAAHAVPTTPTHAVAATGVAVQAKRPWPKVQPADVTTGPSRWLGPKLRHPRGGRFYPAVLRWANLALAVMREHRIRAKYLRGVLAQIQQESSGNPYAVNRWDSNAKAGHPSKGLLQIIAPTYRYYAKPGYRSLRYQTVPYTNLWASLDYVIDRYGRGKFKLWNRGRNQGY